MTSLNRRHFLRLTAAAAATGAVTACGGTPSAPAPTTAGGGSTPAPGNPTAAPKPTTAATTGGTAPTAAALNVSQAQPTAAPMTTTMTAPAQYKEAPQFAELVKAGKLPPVAMRMPEKPMVIKPIESMGVYGGVWHRAFKGLSDRVGPTKLSKSPPCAGTRRTRTRSR